MNSQDWIKTELRQGKIRRIFDATMNSLIYRLTEDGYFQESFSGRYDGAFTRSIGAYGLFLTETGMFERAEKVLGRLFDLVFDYHLSRQPHWFTDDGSTIDMYDQIDGAAHCILAYASLCLSHDHADFENKYYGFARKEIITFFSEPYFEDGSGEIPDPGTDWDRYDSWADEVLSNIPVYRENAPNLVRNFNFEHTREYHYWNCYDILTQSFVGAAADKMILLAQKKGDGKLMKWLSAKADIHRRGIAERMTFDSGGKTMYLEMRVPREGSFCGVPFEALGWPCFIPIVIGWEGCDSQIASDTIEYMLDRTRFTDPVSKVCVNGVEYMPNGQVFHEIFGKTLAFAIEYLIMQKKWDGIADWLRFICANSEEGPITEKYTPVDRDNKSLIDDCGRPLYSGDLPTGSRLTTLDCGNGEQCVWFCRAVYHLCLALHAVDRDELFGSEPAHLVP